jgi:hypothetical protein
MQQPVGCVKRTDIQSSAVRFTHLVVLLLVWTAAPAAALAQDRPATPFSYELTPLEQRLFADARDGQFHESSLWRAALVASGVEDADSLDYYQQQFDSLVRELRRSGAVHGPTRRQAEAVFRFMHRRILGGGYCLESTDLRQALDHGRFNCVSASVLFNCLAGEFGLAVCALETPGHAMSRLPLPEGPLDIETTCSRWFQLIDDPEKQAKVVEKTLGRSPAKDHRQGREVSPTELIAMIYYNRGVDLLGEKRFAAAAAANAKAVQLDPSNTTARGNFLATLNNWAIELGRSDHYAEAAVLLRQGLDIDPTYETFALNYVHLYRQWAERLCAVGRFDQAMAILTRGAAEQPKGVSLAPAQAEVYHRWAEAVGGRAKGVGRGN